MRYQIEKRDAVGGLPVSVMSTIDAFLDPEFLSLSTGYFPSYYPSNAISVLKCATLSCSCNDEAKSPTSRKNGCAVVSFS